MQCWTSAESEVRVGLAFRIDPRADNLALIIDAHRVGEAGTGVLELQVGSVRVSEEAVRRAVAIPG